MSGDPLLDLTRDCDKGLNVNETKRSPIVDLQEPLVFLGGKLTAPIRVPNDRGARGSRGFGRMFKAEDVDAAEAVAGDDSFTLVRYPAGVEWAVSDETAFHERAIATIVDHGVGLPIFPAHWLKTWHAVRDEVAAGLPAGARTAMLAAVNRLLAVRFKQRHALRTAHQALGFVGREG